MSCDFDVVDDQCGVKVLGLDGLFLFFMDFFDGGVVYCLVLVDDYVDLFGGQSDGSVF